MKNGRNAQTSAPGFAKHPGYQVDITRSPAHLRYLVDGVVVADTHKALAVTETRHRPVWYVPMSDVVAEALTRTGHQTHCPFKGDASYWSLQVAGRTLENAVWGYEDPFLECLPLVDHVSFYTDRVTLEVDGELQDSIAPGWTD